jgi:hypothetical protein
VQRPLDEPRRDPQRASPVVHVEPRAWQPVVQTWSIPGIHTHTLLIRRRGESKNLRQLAQPETTRNLGCAEHAWDAGPAGMHRRLLIWRADRVGDPVSGSWFAVTSEWH